MPSSLLLTDCALVGAPAGARLSVLVRDGVIAAIGSALSPDSVERLDGGGRTLAPGLIDLHVHGAGGADLLDGTREALETISRTLARLGTTSFLGTGAPRPRQGNRHLAVAAECVGERLGGARLLGLHLEGPFVNLERRGGLLPEGIHPPSLAPLEEILDITDGTLRMMTIAPELEGSLPLIERLCAEDIIASFGHSNATYEETRAGLAAGITHVTHLYNAMPSLHHRAPGPLVAILEAEHVMVQLVSDGVHVDGRVIGWTARVLGPSRCVCITDGMRTVGMPDGEYVMYGRAAESRNGIARYTDGTLIGTALGLDEIVRRFHRFTGFPFCTALDSATRHPAEVLGIARRTGSLEIGADADLILLDADHSVWATIVGGEVVYRARQP